MLDGGSFELIKFSFICLYRSYLEQHLLLSKKLGTLWNSLDLSRKILVFPRKSQLHLIRVVINVGHSKYEWVNILMR